MHSKPSGGEKMGYGQATADQQKTDALTSGVTANNAQYNGPVTSTPFYKSMLSAGTDSTNRAYDNASRNMKMQMEGAGVGGSSGAVQGNNAALAATRAGSLGQIQPAAIESATQNQFRANEEQLQQAGMYSGAGLGYFGGANQDEQTRLAKRGSMWDNLVKVGQIASMPYTGGM